MMHAMTARQHEHVCWTQCLHHEMTGVTMRLAIGGSVRVTAPALLRLWLPGQLSAQYKLHGFLVVVA